MKKYIYIICLFSALFCVSCGGDKKQSQSSITDSIDEETKFAQTLYGEKSTIIAKGDLLGNGKMCAIAALIKQKTDNSYWVEKASMFQKDNNNWKVILKMEDKLSGINGELVNQVDAKHGYILNIDSSKKPVIINIVMANENGKGASDEAVIKWDEKKNDFKFTAPYEEIPQ